MLRAFAVLLALHALIHALGFFKAFGLARLAQLTLPISRATGLLWLMASALLLGAAIALLVAPRWFWVLAGVGVVLSQIVIVASWRDARFGTFVNVLALLGVVYGAAAWGPFGLRSEYQARTARRLAGLAPAPLLTDADLRPLPSLVQRYLRLVGVVGRPRVRGFRARFSGRIRSGPAAPWMTFTGEQHNFVEPEARLFWMEATMRGLPVDAFHAYESQSAGMRVRLLSLFPVVDASGPNFTRGETVTLFNDRCIMAPATLVDPAIRWKELDPHSVEATYSNGPHTIRAVLIFADTGELVNFWSDDRPSLSPDLVTFVPERWSTPVGDYGEHAGLRLAARGEARYAAPSGDYAYIQFDGLDVSYDLGPASHSPGTDSRSPAD